MKTRVFSSFPILFVIGVSLTSATVPVEAGDLEDLRSTLERSLVALGEMDLDTFLESYHDDMVFYSHAAPFPAVGKAAWKQALRNYFADNEMLSFKAIEPEFRIINNANGALGIAWSQFLYTRKPKDGPTSFVAGRFLITYTRSEGKWLAIAQHNSVLPTGQ